MRLYKISESYYTLLQENEKNIIRSKKLIGTIIRLNHYIYFLPIDGVDESDFNDSGNLKHSPSVFRMVDSNQEYIGKLLLSNMFPVPYKELIQMKENDILHISVPQLEKKLNYIKKNLDRIEKAAQRLYKQKIKNHSQGYLKSTVDFIKLEQVADSYEQKNYGKHYNLFPDEMYFISNPNEFGISYYYLMNKMTKVAKLVLNNETNTVIEIIEEINSEYAPLECFKDNKLNTAYMTSWFKNRGIPSWRDGLYDLLDNLAIKNKDILLNKAFGLSLSDQYWMNPVDKPLDWNDINFFTNDFNSKNFIEACFENKVQKRDSINLFTPNNTSDGMLKKAWIVAQNKTRFLLKGSFKQMDLEPFCEVLASMICKSLNIDYVDYSIEIVGTSLVSKCPCFITPTTELLSAYSILQRYGINLNNKDSKTVYQEYVRVLTEHGLIDVEEKLAKMFILDYLIVNKDRHLGNFGVIRDVNTLKWLDVAPIYDSGQAMYSQNKIYEYNFQSVSGTFFNNKEVDFETIIDIVLENVVVQLDKNNLLKIADEWKTLLERYKSQTAMTDEKIEALHYGLLIRINKLFKHINNHI